MNFSTVPPTYTPPGVQVVEEGMDITVALTVEARPAALTSPTLARDGGATVASDTVVTAISVVFVDVQRADAGLYTLTSTNDAGEGSVDFTLDVQCKLQGLYYVVVLYGFTYY